MDKDPFKEYMKQSEPNKRDKGYAWHTAIGLQAVDGLKTSKYLIDTAIKNIEGDISIDEAQELLNTYYEENPKADIEDRTEEADKVAVRIAKILSEKAFSFTPNEYISRANYNDLKNGVHETTEYLELFLRNLLLDEKNELHNRTMHISGRFAEVDIERVKVDIESGEVDIESTKVDIRNKLLSFSDTISEKTINHTVEIFSKCGKENCFGRTIVEEITGLKPSGASKLIKLLVDSEVIVPVTGHGKGKYRFQ